LRASWGARFFRGFEEGLGAAACFGIVAIVPV